MHIGDSHIQADWWTGYLRIRLQELFGSAGRGLVFPYQLAGTNSPTDIRSGSNQIWENRRSTHLKSETRFLYSLKVGELVRFFHFPPFA